MPTQSEIINANFKYLNGKIDEIELFKFPNAIIAGNPDIDHGQVSNFSNVDFLQFPFLVDLTNRRFRAEFCFTTGDDVTTQQNILDSEFGLALAIKNGKGLMAIGHNGTSWAGQVVGSFNIQPRTTYYANLTWNRINYQTQLSTNGTDYTPDMNFGSTQSPYPRTMFIGGSPDLFGPGTAHPFKGSINLNKCFLYIEEQLVWQGMDDAGLATRADISLDNLDAAGQAKFDAKQDTLVSGTNIKTINNESILGEGNIEIKGGADNAFTPDNLKGGNGIEIVESIKNKVIVSDFSTNRYIKIKQLFPSFWTNRDFVFNVVIPTNITSADYPIINIHSTVKDIFFEGSSRRICVWSGSQKFSGRTFSAGENIWVRVIDNDLYTIIDNNYSLNNLPKIEEWNKEFTFTDFFFGDYFVLGSCLGHNSQFWDSSIILSNCRIKIDGITYLNGAESDKFDVIGSPTITVETEGEVNYVINATSGFDFEGTLAEYEQAQPTLAEDAKCLITDDVGIIPTEITQEQLNDKADRDLANCTKPYVVEQYDDGAGNGYRVWSNKWCEQYFLVTTTASNSNSITFFKEYADLNFKHSVDLGPTNGNWIDVWWYLHTKTTTSAVIYNRNATSYIGAGKNISVEFKGYIL